MLSFAKVVGAFLGMVVAAYLAVVMIFPPPVQTSAQADDVVTGRSAAVRLTDQAALLVGNHKAVSATAGDTGAF